MYISHIHVWLCYILIVSPICAALVEMYTHQFRNGNNRRVKNAAAKVALL